ncbi:hypothetical protein MASR2M78_28990 [Treponema sp.]
MIDKFKEAFREEAVELLANLEATLLELEENPLDIETISSVFRTMHTIKGSSAMFGFDAISHFTHEVESIMDLLREGSFIADRRFIDLTLQTRDLISSMLSSGNKDFSAEVAQLVKEFKDHSDKKIAEHKAGLNETVELPAQQNSLETEKQAEIKQKEGAQTSAMDTYRIHFKPASDVFLNGTRPLLLLDELSALGEMRCKPLLDSLPALADLEVEKCYIGWDILLRTDKGLDAVRDVFIFVEGSSELSIEKLSEKEVQRTAEYDDASDIKRLGEILVERGVTTPERIRGVEYSRKRIGELLVEEKIATSEQVKSALDEQDQLKRSKEKQQDLGTSSIRVASDKLDALVDMVGELVTLQARLSRSSVQLQDGDLTLISEQYERMVAQLRDNTMSIRMLPIGSTFSKFRRVLRDLSAELGKEIELVTEGAETELDKTVIERLNDPLVHIIRNSVDHGIELPKQRIAAGKDRRGTVALSATHSGAHVLIQVSDDGGGLDSERIFKESCRTGNSCKWSGS